MDIEGIRFKPCKCCGLDTPAEELVRGMCEDCLTSLYAPDIEDWVDEANPPRKLKWDDEV